MTETARHTILAVDDTPQNLDILKDLLGGQYRVLAAKSGAAALDLMARTVPPPSLVLLDIMMPDLDGFETLGRLRLLPGGDALPVIFISAVDDVASKVKGFSLGAVDYVTKPFEPEEVLARVKTHLALVDAARMKEDVERIMRHDLKSPLNAILATAGFELDNEDLDEGTRESLQIVLDSALAMKEMIDLSLDLFKMEQGTYRLDAQAVDLNRLLARIHRDLGPLLGAGDLTWVWAGGDPDDGVERTIWGSELLSSSLLGNLLKNAAEAAPRGGTVTVTLPDPGPRAVLKIRNPGEIPLGLRPRLFQKYATAGKISGTGLGLYSARLVATALGAGLTADTSEPGHTTFEVDFPTPNTKE
jgi:DNA-binding response OmpR family regulator